MSEIVRLKERYHNHHHKLIDADKYVLRIRGIISLKKKITSFILFTQFFRVAFVPPTCIIRLARQDKRKTKRNEIYYIMEYLFESTLFLCHYTSIRGQKFKLHSI